MEQQNQTPTAKTARTVVLQGNEACAKAALLAGCRFFAGYPITPSTEIIETLALEMEQTGGTFVQMEDEIAAARAATEMQVTKTLQDEKSAVDTFRAANIRITEPDIALFRAAVFKEYEQSGMTAKWKPGLQARIQAGK